MLAGLFERCLKRRGVKATDPYDWERPFISNESLPTTRSLPSNYQVAMPPVLTTATTINQAPTTPNVDTNNQENVEPDNRKELDVKRLNRNVYWISLVACKLRRIYFSISFIGTNGL